jgi:hypothetical protein
VYLLLCRLAYQLGKTISVGGERDVIGITLCVQTGNYARLTHLAIDLPWCDDPMNIVVLAIDSYGESCFSVAS